MQAPKSLDDIAALMRHPRKGIESRSAILESERFDVIRGKDFVRWLQKHPETLDFLSQKRR
jgi:hypothetical protein